MKLDLVTGFLGAGKTTLIARYGEYLREKGIRFAVVENEFGAAGVDTAILRAYFGEVRELSGGCICCTLKSGFYQLLEELSRSCDRVIIEPSGLYNLDDFFEVADALVRESIAEYGLCVTLADPRMIESLSEAERDILRDELIGTGAVVWTKTDKCPEMDLSAAERELIRIAEGLPLRIFPVSGPDIRGDVFEVLQKMLPQRQAHERFLRDHQTLYSSTSLRPAGEYDAEGLVTALKMVLSGGNILRLKGFVDAREGSLAVNCTAEEISVETCVRQQVMLNVIGRNIDRRAVKAALEQGANT